MPPAPELTCRATPRLLTDGRLAVQAEVQLSADGATLGCLVWTTYDADATRLVAAQLRRLSDELLAAEAAQRGGTHG